MVTLKDLRVSAHKTQAEVARFLGIDRTTYTKYETGGSEPNFETAIKLAEYFCVSTDYLLGISDKKESAAQSDEPSDNAKLLDEILCDAGIDLKVMTDSDRQRIAATLKAAFGK